MMCLYLQTEHLYELICANQGLASSIPCLAIKLAHKKSSKGGDPCQLMVSNWGELLSDISAITFVISVAILQKCFKTLMSSPFIVQTHVYILVQSMNKVIIIKLNYIQQFLQSPYNLL